jgi:hypothetical protein
MRKTVVTLAIVIGLFAAAMVPFAVVIVPGMGDGAVVTPAPTQGALVDPAGAGYAQADLLQDVPVRTAPDGQTLKEAPGEDFPVTMYRGLRVVILGTTTSLTGGWARVYVLPSESAWPSDIYAWIPVAQDGKPVLDIQPGVDCPTEVTLASLAGLSPQDRLRCAGSGELVLEGHTTFHGETLGYNVSPAFFGSADAPASVGLSANPAARPVVSADDDPRLPITSGPGVEAIPVDVDVRATGRFDFPGAAACRRSQPDTMGVVPVEAAADSAAWCRARFIVTSWELVNGPEGRPPVAGEIQLHRHPAFNACGGVGMPPLTLHIDPSAPEQVWLTAAGFPRPIMASFSDAFTAVTTPVPSIIDGSGLVLTDGMPINPDADLGGHMVCPTGDIVYFG